MDTLFSNPILAIAVGALTYVVLVAWHRADRAEQAERRHNTQRIHRP